MATTYFVDRQSIVREIWGKSDTILFIFAGSAAEFALNKAVDWLYFTGKLPGDPLNRLFSTVAYARAIIFSESDAALRAIDAMAAIHARVEEKRAQHIPDWAYRDVLYMLIDYSIRSFELLERSMSSAEKVEVFNVFRRVGNRMGLNGLPATFDDWETQRRSHLAQNLSPSTYTQDLFNQYRKHLGTLRYRILVESQKLVIPTSVRAQLGFSKFSLLSPLLHGYRITRRLKFDWFVKALIVPPKYKNEVHALDRIPQRY